MAAKKNSSKRNEMASILATIENRLTQLFGARYQEVIRINQVRKAIEAGEEFSFDSNPAAARQLEAIINQLAMQATSIIKQGDKEAWEAGDKNASKTLGAIFGKTTDGKKTLDALTERGLEDQRARGATAQNHYRNREEAVSYSTGVWKEQAQKDLELLIQNGIKQGKSAEQISRDIRPYLKNPTAHFKRIRNKETGELELSKAAKDYHPGAGVYRSAFKNALRLARTEVNIAYATAQWEAFQSNPLVTGIRISLSNNHTVLDSKGKPQPLHDMCDELQGDYPKTFRWTPWHPQCRCTMTPITISDDDFKKRMKALFAGDLDDWKPQDTVTKMPDSFNGWMERNKERLAKGKSIPAFIRDNFQNGDPLAKLNPAIRNLEEEVKKQAPQPLDEKTERLYQEGKDAARFCGVSSAVLDELHDTQDKERMTQEAERLNHLYDAAFTRCFKAKQETKDLLVDVADALEETQNGDKAGVKQAENYIMQLDRDFDTKKTTEKEYMAEVAKIKTWATQKLAEAKANKMQPQKPEEQDNFKKETFDTLDDRGQLQFLAMRLHNLRATNPSTVYMATFNADKYQRLAADKNATKTQLKQAIKQAKLDIETVLQTADPDLQKNMKEWMTGQAKTEMNVVSMRTRTFAALIGEEEEIAREIEQSIHDFTYKWDYEIRAYQTGKKFHPKAGHSMVEIRKKADNIESYIRKAPSWQGGVTYRGIELSDAELAPYLNPGYTFDMRGISSWTTSIGTANTFAHHTDDQDQNHVIFICKSAQPRGTSIRGISHYTSEREILLSSAARWRVISWQCLNPSAKEKDYEIACEAL